MHTRRVVLGLASVVVALLLARVVMLVFAANPAHPFVPLVRLLTDPLLLPVAWIDANQPRYGARFERGPLLVIGGVVLLVMIHSWRERTTVEGRQRE